MIPDITITAMSSTNVNPGDLVAGCLAISVISIVGRESRRGCRKKARHVYGDDFVIHRVGTPTRNNTGSHRVAGRWRAHRWPGTGNTRICKGGKSDCAALRQYQLHTQLSNFGSHISLGSLGGPPQATTHGDDHTNRKHANYHDEYNDFYQTEPIDTSSQFTPVCQFTRPVCETIVSVVVLVPDVSVIVALAASVAVALTYGTPLLSNAT